MKKRNSVIVEIHPDFIASWFKNTPAGCVIHSIKGVPQDAEMQNFHFDDLTGMFYAVFYHESFKPVPLGERLPVLDCVFTAGYCFGGVCK